MSAKENAEKGREYFLNREYKNAALKFSASIAENYKPKWVCQQLAQAYLNLSDYDTALDQFTQLTIDYPEELAGYLGKAKALQNLDRVEDSIVQYKITEQLFPNNILVLDGMCNLLPTARDAGTAATLLNLILEIYNSIQVDVPIHISFQLISLTLHQGNLKAANIISQKLIGDYPEDPRGYIGLAKIEGIDPAFHHDPPSWATIKTKFHDHPLAMSELAIHYRQTGQNDLALDAYKKLIQIKPEEKGLYLQIIHLYLSLQQYHEAKQMFEDLLVIDSENPHTNLLIHLLNLLLENTLLVDADSLVKRYLNLFPNSELQKTLRLKLKDAYFQKNRYDKTIFNIISNYVRYTKYTLRKTITKIQSSFASDPYKQIQNLQSDTESTDIKTITHPVLFLEEPSRGHSSSRYYIEKTQTIRKILEKQQIRVSTVDLRDSVNTRFNNLDTMTMDALQDSESSGIMILSPVNLVFFLLNLDRYSNELYKFILKQNYIFVFGELIDSDSKIFGWSDKLLRHRDFIREFFKRANLVAVSNIVSYKSLKSMRLHNLILMPLDGYTACNEIDCKAPEDIDLLIYGSRYVRRQYFIERILERFGSKFKIHIETELFGVEMDHLIMRSKIILHVNSHENLQHLPWAKMGKLLSNNKFFIIEECLELYETKLNEKYAFTTFHISRIDDLCNKIIYYLNHSCERQEIASGGKTFIKSLCNFDVLWPRLLHQVSNDAIGDRLQERA